MGTYENTAAAANDECQLSINRLMQIDGIAKKTAEAMVEIDIHSYADLTRYLSQHTAQEVSAALKEHGVNRPPALIDLEAWTRQAEQFSQLEDAATTPPEEQTEPFATEHIATQAEVTGEPPPPEAIVPSFPTRLNNAGLEIDEVQLSVIGPASEFPEKRLKAEINFQLSGAGAEALSSQGIHFRIESYTVDLESGVSELAASSRSQLEPQLFKYRAEQEFSIPDVGRYRFHSLVLLLPPGDMVAYHKGPTLRVVP
jgi:hypothetical protein